MYTDAMSGKYLLHCEGSCISFHKCSKVKDDTPRNATARNPTKPLQSAQSSLLSSDEHCLPILDKHYLKVDRDRHLDYDRIHVSIRRSTHS